jgi:hypothetical protein
MPTQPQLSPERTRELDQAEAESRAAAWSLDPVRRAKTSDRHIWLLAAAEWNTPGTIAARSKARGKR